MADAIKTSNRQYTLLAMATINVIYDYLKRRRHYINTVHTCIIIAIVYSRNHKLTDTMIRMASIEGKLLHSTIVAVQG